MPALAFNRSIHLYKAICGTAVVLQRPIMTKQTLHSNPDLSPEFEHAASCRTDRSFVLLIVVQWAALVTIAIWLRHATPYGMQNLRHGNLLLALVGGGVAALISVVSNRVAPGSWQTRHGIAVAQMLMSSLLILVTHGRAESHFHIFASLALLAFYLDWTVLLTASIAATIDHLLRGIFWPELLLGAAGGDKWRWAGTEGSILLACACLMWASIERRRYLADAVMHQSEADALMNKAHTDVLTGLPNRLSFQQWMEVHLQQRRASREPFALMYIDLDRFKEINDRLGHAAGDVVLKEAARRLATYIVPRSLLTRVGGDEFIAAFSHVPKREEFAEIAQEITSLLMLPFHYQGERLYLGASIGISTFPDHGETEQELVHAADQAMYRVKQHGRRGFYFCETPEALGAGALGERALQTAIDHNQLELHFQPLVNVSTQIVAFEALVRWRCPERGLIPPAEFIGVAEQSGQIIALGRVVLDKAVQQAAEWLRQKLDFGHITINVSPRQLIERDFVRYLEGLLEQHGVPATAICLECTESACASDIQVQSQLQKLHARGIRIYVDDFGTGYSSLGRLQEMQFDVIKIDRCFIQRLTTSDTGSEIVSLMISFAHLVGMTVVAEGVETAEQFEALQALGCDHIQGFFVSKPMEMADATDFLKGHQPSEHAGEARQVDPQQGVAEQTPGDLTFPSRTAAPGKSRAPSKAASWADVFALQPGGSEA